MPVESLPTDAELLAEFANLGFCFAHGGHGNFRLLERLVSQIERVMKINGLTVITNDVIEAAQSTLVIGVS